MFQPWIKICIFNFLLWKKLAAKKLYQDQLSGTKANRPGLFMALEVLRKNDTLIVWKIDRLGRTVKGLMDLVNCLHPFFRSKFSN